ncbi:MAG: hypothetical protein V1709_08960 [Planctomycetota bacterium]
MNLQKGFYRITFILSNLTGIISLLVVLNTASRPIETWAIPLAFLFGFIPVWLIYFFIKYIVVNFIIKGFKEKEQSIK